MVPADGPKAESSASNAANERQAEERAARFRWRLTANETLTLLVGVGALVVSGLTYENSRDTSDIKKAIGNLAALADQTKRQADTQAKQLALLREQRQAVFRQADAAADSAKAALETAQTAKRQTGAIVKQADALIKGAQATIVAASAQLASAQANNRTAEAGLKAAQVETQAALAVSATATPVARFGGLQMAGIMGNADKDGMVNFTIHPYFINAGTVAIIPLDTKINLLFAKYLPSKPIIKNVITFGGNDFTAQPGSAFGVSVPQKMNIDKITRDELIKHNLRIFVWGISKYMSPRGTKTYRMCFVAEVYPTDSAWATFEMVRIESAAYSCDD